VPQRQALLRYEYREFLRLPQGARDPVAAQVFELQRWPGRRRTRAPSGPRARATSRFGPSVHPLTFGESTAAGWRLRPTRQFPESTTALESLYWLLPPP